MTAHIEQIIDEHSAHLLRLAYFYTKNRHAAEDIVQDVLIKFCEAPYEERGQLRAYLTRITINKSKDYLKSWAYKKIVFQQKIFTKGKADQDSIVRQEERSAIGAAILQLPLKYREPIILYYFEEMAIADVAEALVLPENTIKTRLRRAREQLKPHLQGEWEVLANE